MAKFPAPCKDKRAQKIITSFSELEIDLVWLLVKMSSSDGRLIQVKNNKKDDAEHRSCEGGASNLPSLFHTISEEEEEEEEEEEGEIYPMRRNKRSRSIDHIYQVTEPVLQGFVCGKRKRLSC
ncbi:hypothetical protein OIU76_020681 [Salix suchowensis]|nr:hypothetical protein OIU76_020681 [Salix suchowensis]